MEKVIKDLKRMNQPFLYKKGNDLPPPALFLFILSVALLLVVVVFLSNLYVDSRRKLDVALSQLKAVDEQLNELRIYLVQGDLEKALTNLDRAQKSVSTIPLAPAPEAKTELAEVKAPGTVSPAGEPSVAPAPEAKTALAEVRAPDAVPPPVLPSPKPVETVPVPKPVEKVAPAPPAVKPAVLTIADDQTPYPFIVADANEHLLVCEKEKERLHLFRYRGNRFELIKSYACIVGANGSDKAKAGDLATPIGNYFTLRYIDGKSLPEKYGPGAFVLNYPNFLDRKARKDGSGIWLHGHTPGKNLGDPELQNTQGCIAVSNDVFTELKGLLKARGTPVVVVNQLKLAKTAEQRQLHEVLSGFMTSWAEAWGSMKIDRFMDHYSPEFMSDGMNYGAFKRQKVEVNKGKTYIRVKVDHLAILLPQERGGEIAVARFLQRYDSSNFRGDSWKLFYLKKGQKGWRIIGESRF